MPRRIRIRFGQTSLEAEMNDSRTAQAIWDALPLKSKGNRWGKEIYFSIPVRLPGEDPQDVVKPGALAYWPEGPAFCIFWGPTPVSQAQECRPYSPVNVFGSLTGDWKILDQLQEMYVLVERIEWATAGTA
jgi:uncharacterized protein